MNLQFKLGFTFLMMVIGANLLDPIDKNDAITFGFAVIWFLIGLFLMIYGSFKKSE